MNKKNIFLGVVLVVIILIFRAYPFFNTDTMPISLEARNSELNSGKGSNTSKYMQSKSAKAKVIGLIPNKSGSNKVSNKVKVKITAGKYKGKIVTVDNLIDNTDTNKNDIEYYNVKKNDEVILHYDIGDEFLTDKRIYQEKLRSYLWHIIGNDNFRNTILYFRNYIKSYWYEL